MSEKNDKLVIDMLLSINQGLIGKLNNLERDTRSEIIRLKQRVSQLESRPAIKPGRIFNN